MVLPDILCGGIGNGSSNFLGHVFAGCFMSDAEKYKATLITTLWQIINRYGEDGNIVILDGMKDNVPPKVTIGWNIIGDDIIVTALEETK